MLDVLRRNAGSWAIKIILGFIAVTFIWWGVGSYTERERDTAATVGDAKISMVELAEAVSGIEKTYRDVYGSAFTPEMAKTIDLRKQALESLVQKTLLLSEARKLGLLATDAEIQREIAQTPAFQVNGAFNVDRYRSVLGYNRIGTTEYEATKRQEITLKKMEGLLSAAARVPETEARDLFDAVYRKVRLLVVSSNPEKARGVSPPSAEEISSRYAETKESYRVPARVRLLLARFEPGDFAKNVSPSEEEIRAFYEGNSDKFRTDEERLLSQIFLPYAGKDREDVHKKAVEVAASAGKGKAEFEAAAKKHSKGKFGEAWTKRKDARPEVAESAFSGPVDSIAGPVDIGNGFLILRINKIRFPETLPLSKVRDRVTALLRHEKGKDLAVIKVYEAHTKASASKDLKGACAPFGIVPATTGWSGDGKADGIPPPVVQDALLLAAGEIGPVKTIGDAHYLYQVFAKEESRIPPPAEVRDKIAAALLKEKKRAAARAALEKVLAGAKSASDLERNARKEGLPAAAGDFFSPLADPPPAGLPPTGENRRILASLAARAPVHGKVVEVPGRFLALAFVEERAAGDKEWAAGKEAFLKNLREEKKARMLEAFLAERRKQAKVEINPEALK
jgi:peptidyl-prolyl cis-trans isomerase D